MKTIPKSELAGDAELVELCLGENRNAFASIITRYQSLICSIAYSACGDLGRSEDLAQDTFVTAWKRLRELKEPAKLKSWLCGIARNLSNNSVRRDLRTPTAHSDPLPPEVCSGGGNPHEQAVSKEEEAMVWRALEAIPADYREPMILFYREGQSAQAVAAALDLTEEAVWQRLSRGRVMLKAGVAKTVESALGRSVPGKAFTGAVLAALAVFPSSAKAATVGATAAKGGASAKSVAAVGAVPGFGIVMLFSLLKAQIENTKSLRERQFMVRWMLLRLVVCIVGVTLFEKLSPLVQDPFAREVAISAVFIGVAVYSVVVFEVTNRWRRRIQIEDGTFDESEWMMRTKPRDLLADASGPNSKAHFYRMLVLGLVFTMIIFYALSAASHGHWYSALFWIVVFGVGSFRNIRAMQWRPRFEAGFTIVSRSVGLCAVMTLVMVYFYHFYGQADIRPWSPAEMVFSAVIVLVYAGFIGMLAWMHRRESVPGRD